MTDVSITFEKLLASFWLDASEELKNSDAVLESLTRFAEHKGLAVSAETLQEAANHLDGGLAKGNVDQWIVFVCFWGHPFAIWDFMLDAMEVATNDQHYKEIATSLAEHLLAYYGSMIPVFEDWASKDPKFKRMLTGVWRHKMSDQVWLRLRAMQSEVSDPLTTMIPLEKGVEYRANQLSAEDRANADKGRYRLVDGKWQVKSRGRQ